MAAASLLDERTVAILEALLRASARRPLRDTEAAFSAAFSNDAAKFHALACLLLVLRVSTRYFWNNSIAQMLWMLRNHVHSLCGPTTDWLYCGAHAHEAEAGAVHSPQVFREQRVLYGVKAVRRTI